MERREAPAFLATGKRGKTERLVRRSVLHPLGFSRGESLVPAQAGKDDGLPGAAKNRGDDAYALSYPSPERGWVGERSEPGWGHAGKRPHQPLASARGTPPPQAGEG